MDVELTKEQIQAMPTDAKLNMLVECSFRMDATMSELTAILKGDKTQRGICAKVASHWDHIQRLWWLLGIGTVAMVGATVAHFFKG